MVHGILAVDKPSGLSSAAVVARVKRALGEPKVGHTGTLDPFATGLMLLGINKGTRISRFFLGGSKSYEAGVCLGVETDTLDPTGEVIRKTNTEEVSRIDENRVREILDSFLGIQQQSPPIYSALKHNGQPLYRLARQGKPVQKPPREIEIHSISLLDFQPGHFRFQVHCSSGTYIRSIARDLGERLGCGAHLSSLCRSETCGFTLDQALPLATILEMGPKGADHIISMADALPALPCHTADDDLLLSIRFGRPIHLDFQLDTGTPFVRIVDQAGELAAIVEFDQERKQYNYCCVFLN